MAARTGAGGHPSRLAEDGEHLRMTAVRAARSSTGKICRVIMVNKTFLPMRRRAAAISNSL
jgi:hypothetical protein